MTDESVISRMAEASTMLRTMKRLMALSLATSTPEASHRTRLTCKAQFRQPVTLLSEIVALLQQQQQQEESDHGAHMATAVLGTSIVSSFLRHVGRLQPCLWC